MSAEFITTLKNAVPAKYHKLVDKVKNGSLKAAVKLKCLDCCGFETQAKKEVRLCNIQECSLWAFRPYKPKGVSLKVVSP
jgi:hypothetical protein